MLNSSRSSSSVQRKPTPAICQPEAQLFVVVATLVVVDVVVAAAGF